MLEIIIENMKILRQAKAPELDSDNFAQLYEHHVGPVFNYFLFHGANSMLAEDLTSDTFERAWRARRAYEPERASFSTWLFVIARHILIDEQRRTARRLILSLTASQDEIAQPSPEMELEDNERQNRLLHLLRTLPDYEQELIALKFGAGMPNKQIALVVGKSETAIGSALHRVMRKLRHQWEDSHEISK